jgi:hypothetical protein
MEILEKQISYNNNKQISILDDIKAEVLNLTSYKIGPEKIWDVDVLEILEKYKTKI